jgi:uncharacterized protein YjdB
VLDRHLACIAIVSAFVLSCSGNSTGPNAHGVADISMMPDTLTIATGDSAAIQAQAVNATGTPVPDVSLFWSTSDSSVATVDQSGMVKATGIGAVNIDASTAGISPKHPARVVVTAQPVASIVIAPTALALFVGGAFQLTDTTKDATGKVLVGRVVSWTSSDSNVASVDQAGLVLGKRLGSATITVSSGSVSAAAAVTVSRVPVAKIVIAPSHPTVVVGQETQLSATPQDSAGNTLTGVAITWSSADPTTATIDQTGTASGKKPGAVTITAASGSVSASTSLTVQAPSANAVTVSPQSSSLIVGQTLTVTAVVTDASGSPLPNATVAFSSGAPGVATVTSTGALTATATAVGSGQAQITGTSGGIIGTATVNVTPVPVGSVTISPSGVTIAQDGGTAQLTATVKDTAGHVLTGRTITWTSLNPGVAAVSSTGLVVAVSAGEAVISASTGGQSGVAAVTVGTAGPPTVNTVIVTPDTATITNSNNSSVQLTATLEDAQGNTITGPSVTWSSDNPDVAVVSSTGLVMANDGGSHGTATIRATSEGKQGTATVIVVNSGG